MNLWQKIRDSKNLGIGANSHEKEPCASDRCPLPSDKFIIAEGERFPICDMHLFAFCVNSIRDLRRGVESHHTGEVKLEQASEPKPNPIATPPRIAGPFSVALGCYRCGCGSQALYVFESPEGWENACIEHLGRALVDIAARV